MTKHKPIAGRHLFHGQREVVVIAVARRSGKSRPHMVVIRYLDDGIRCVHALDRLSRRPRRAAA